MIEVKIYPLKGTNMVLSEKIKSSKELIEIAMFILDSESGERESYIDMCETLEIAPERIRGRDQRLHIYAKALIGLGLKFPKGNIIVIDI